MPNDIGERVGFGSRRRRTSTTTTTTTTTPPPSTTNNTTTANTALYPPTSVSTPAVSISPKRNIRPERRMLKEIGRRTILGHTVVMSAQADIYRLGTNDYISWYNNIPDPPTSMGGQQIGKVDESTLVVGYGLKLGVGSDILFKGDDILGEKTVMGNGNKPDLPYTDKTFMASASVTPNENLSELIGWVYINNAIQIDKHTNTMQQTKHHDYFLDWTTPVLGTAGSLLKPYPVVENNTNTRHTYGRTHRPHVTNQWGTYTIDRVNPDPTPADNKTLEGAKHESIYTTVNANNSTIEVVLPNDPYTERYNGSDHWVESSSIIKVTGNNNFVRVVLNDRQTHLWRYSGNDGHRSLVSIEGYNNIVVVVVNGTLDIGFERQYDNYGYWLVSNDHRNLLIVSTNDGSPLHTKVRWRNIENMNTAGTGPTSYFCKYEHNGEHNPFKSWI